MYSSTDSTGSHSGGLSLASMGAHWIEQIIEPTRTYRTSDTGEYDIMTSWFIDILFRQYLQEYVRTIINGQKTINMLEIELTAMREFYAINWMNIKTDGQMFHTNIHGHTLQSCYNNLNNPMYRHTGHSPAHHKCLWEYYLNQVNYKKR